METSLLFAELDDTIQFDILKISNEKWLTLKEKSLLNDSKRIEKQNQLNKKGLRS